MKIEVQFVLKIHVLPLSSIILISLKQWLSGQTNCYLRFTQDTKIKIAVIQKIQHGNNPLNQKFKKNVKILHVIQSTYQLKYLHFCLRCHILSLRGWHFSLLYKLNIGKEQIYYTFLSYSIHGYTCARSSLMIPLYLCNLHCNNTPTILSPQCHASPW